MALGAGIGVGIGLADFAISSSHTNDIEQKDSGFNFGEKIGYVSGRVLTVLAETISLSSLANRVNWSIKGYQRINSIIENDETEPFFVGSKFRKAHPRSHGTRIPARWVSNPITLSERSLALQRFLSNRDELPRLPKLTERLL